MTDDAIPKYKNDEEARTSEMAYSALHRAAMLLYSQANLIESLMKGKAHSTVLAEDLERMTTRLRQAADMLHRPLAETASAPEKV